MRKSIAGVLAVLGLLGLAPIKAQAISGVLCIKTTGKGAVKVRNPACKATEVQVGTYDTAASQASLTGQDVSVRVSYTGNVPIANATQGPLPFGVGSTEEYDTGALHDDVTNPERLTAPIAGKYYIHGQVSWFPGGGTSRYLLIRVNGTTYVVSSGVAPITNPSHSTEMHVSTHVDLQAGDYVTLDVYQNSGGTLPILSQAFGMVKVP